MTTYADIPEISLKNLHFETLEWKSNLQFIQGEVNFINQLLHSYVFEPTTPNLFEKLQEYREKIKNYNLHIEFFFEKVFSYKEEEIN